MIRIRGIRLRPTDAVSKKERAKLTAAAAKRLRRPVESIEELRILKKSLDARHKNDIVYLYTVAVTVTSAAGTETQLLKNLRDKEIDAWEPTVYRIERLPQTPAEEERPIVAGFGPAGIFAALVLAKAGARPIVIERGQDARTRRQAVEAFRGGGPLDPENNVQFGEGGAGTFSDGKLATGTHDSRLGWVMEQFAVHGAPESVQWDAKPHVGTDVLVQVVQRFRQEITELGGEVRFGTRLERLCLKDGALQAAEVTCGGKSETLPCRRLILAVGHSARDTFTMLHELGVPMEAKPFSMGVRIEHPQALINAAQYGPAAEAALPPADYSLNVHLPDGSSAYTFCMCPGGYVIAAASEAGGVVTNGMSYSGRAGENANSALLVTLHPEDFPGEGVLAGMEWQRAIERACYRYGGNNMLAPAQLAGDFLKGKASSGPGRVKPAYLPGVVWGSLDEVLPPRITGVLKQALPELGRKLPGFDDPEAVLTAPETRSSSPVRILRGAELMSPVTGLWPCGEGAGYAGGISSAAADGMRCAEAVLRSMGAPETK